MSNESEIYERFQAARSLGNPQTQNIGALARMQDIVNSSTPPKLKIYTASLTKHYPVWIELRKTWPDFEFTARWPYYCQQQVPPTSHFATEFWQRDFDDINRADVLLCYGVNGDPLRGALVEAGYALANNMRVLAVGDSPSFGTWQYHPQVTRIPTLGEAMDFLTFLQNTNPT